MRFIPNEKIFFFGNPYFGLKTLASEATTCQNIKDLIILKDWFSRGQIVALLTSNLAKKSPLAEKSLCIIYVVV